MDLYIYDNGQLVGECSKYTTELRTYATSNDKEGTLAVHLVPKNTIVYNKRRRLVWLKPALKLTWTRHMPDTWVPRK